MMLEITAHPDRSTKAGGGKEYNEKEILWQQQHNNLGSSKHVFTTLPHRHHVKGCDLCSDDYLHVLKVGIAIKVSNN